MLTNGEQKIFIWTDFSAESDIAIMHGLQVARTLNKEVCLMLHKPQASGPDEERLAGLKETLIPALGAGRVHHYLAAMPLNMILTELAEEFDALLLVAHKKHTRELLPHMPHSGFPFLFVSENQEQEINYRRISVPVGYMKKSKDLALWSSYFARHNGAKITLLKAMDSTDEDRKRVMGNLFSIERLFRNFRFPSEIVECHTPTWKIQRMALDHATGYQSGLLIISFTYYSTWIDRLFNLNDQWLIDHSGSLSVMCINSQRDLYTLCG